MHELRWTQRTQKIEAVLGVNGAARRRLREATRERLYDALDHEEELRDRMAMDTIARIFTNAKLPTPPDLR